MTTPTSAYEPTRHALRALLLLTGLLVLFVTAGPSAAATPCGKKVIDDWFDGRIDGTYPLHCYDDAIERLPRDVRDYSSAKEDIERALQARLRGETAPPNSGPGTSTTPTTTDDLPPDNDPGNDPGNDDETSGGGPPGDDPGALPPDDPAAESASSVPLPLLLLAGLALLLIAGGAAGYIVRRMQSRRIPPPAL